MIARKEYTYSYEDGKITRSAECDIAFDGNGIVTAKVLVSSVLYAYDAEGTLIRKRLVSADGEKRVIYYETTDDNTTVKFSAGGKTVTSHSKTDSFGRKVFDELQLGTGFVSRQFSYHAGDATEEHRENAKLRSTPTTQLVSQIVLSDGRTLAYEYDAEERITKVTDSIEGVTEYTYDAMGQLLTEKVNGEVVNEMVYDNYGNILQKNGIRYTYSEGWNDRLAYYDGEHITCDAQGNPLNYLGHTLTWEKGRQLKSFDGIAYTYNANGIRTSKTVDGIRHEYLLDGVNILTETWDDNTLETLYDNEESVCGIVYNGTPYYFHKNLQGDIIAIADQNGEVVARYTYDAWGKCEISVKSTNAAIAEINPYRYRGYYFDTETGFYYLQSRYYDPTVGRFVNGDNPKFPVTYFVLEADLYSYAVNDPVNNIDIGGNIAAFLAKKIGSVIVNAVIGFLAQVLGDVLMSAVRRKWKCSTLGTYVAAVAKGAWDGLWGGGLAKEICKSMLANILARLIDIVRKEQKGFSLSNLLNSVLDGLLSYVIGKIVKVPRYIRDIKKKAQTQVIKGTKKLLKFLNKEIWKKLSFTLSLNGIANFISQFVGAVFGSIKQCAKDMFNGLKKEIGGMAIA